MERAKEIMGKNFIGPEELEKLKTGLGIAGIPEVPPIPIDLNYLQNIRNDYILILGASITLNRMRETLGWDPLKSEPCFYNQDWYLKEDFAGKTTLDSRWYLIKKTVQEDSRGKIPQETGNLPSAVLTAFTFFAYYFLTGGEILWRHDFIWCSDLDHNGDRIYTGRYVDPAGVNKNGFNVHRHLAVRPCYGVVPQIVL